MILGRPTNTRRFLLVAMLGAGLAGGSCSLLTSNDAIQCESDTDCQELAPGATCSSESVCVLAGTGGAGGLGGEGGTGGEVSGCESNQQCIDDNSQLPYICRTPGEPCVSLLNERCPSLTGTIEQLGEDEAIILGHMSRLTDSADIAQLEINGITLAAEEIAANAVGVPGGSQGQRRPVLVLHCDESEDHLAAAAHLIEDVGVPAIMGPIQDSRSLEIALQLAIPNDTMMIVPFSAGEQFAAISDDGLLWQMTAAESLDGVAAGLFVSQTMEQELREEHGLQPTDPLKIFIVARADVTYGPTADAFADALTFNTTVPGITDGSATDNQNQGYLDRVDYNPDNINWASIINDIVAFEPHIVASFSIVDPPDSTAQDFFPSLESSWTAAHLPYYIVSGTQHADEIATFAAGVQNDTDPSFGERFFGGQPIPAQLEEGENYGEFKIRYQNRFDGDPPGEFNAPIAYDATYLLSYGIVAGGATATISGKTIATGIADLLGPGATINVGPNDINQAFSALVAQTSVDLAGVYSPFDFDLATGTNRKDTMIWCFSKNGTFTNSLLFYDTEAGTLDGALAGCFPNAWL